MRTIHALVAIVLAGSPIPAVAQDFLGPLEDFVETLTGPPAQTSPVQTSPAPQPRPVTPPPIPRPRPPDMPDLPAVTPPRVPGTDDTAPAPAAAPQPAAQPGPATENAAAAEPAPDPVPDRVYQAACPAVMMGLVQAEVAPPLSEGICGERSPLIVTAVMSRGRMVPLSTPITTNCQMASALPRWMETVDGYAGAMLGSPLAQVTTGTSYMCRNRNNAADGFTSEHGFANAIDVTGFTLEDGRTMAVETNWLPATAAEGRLLRLAHDAGCAGFTTVLGPEANAEHRDHLHLDLGCHGQSCTARICE